MLPTTTGWNKTLGQKSGGPALADIPSGCAHWFRASWASSSDNQTHYWDAMHGTGNLRKYNGINMTLPSGDKPGFWSFDGSDDWLGMSSDGYGGDTPFSITIDSSTKQWTLTQWVYRDGSSNSYHVYWGLGGYDDGGIVLHSHTSSANQAVLHVSQTDSQDFTHNISHTWPLNEWYQIGLTIDHDPTRSTNNTWYTLYHNGSWAGQVKSGIVPTSTELLVNVGAYMSLIGDTTPYSFSQENAYVSDLHFWDRLLTASEMRHAFSGTHDINNNRYFGNPKLDDSAVDPS